MRTAKAPSRSRGRVMASGFAARSFPTGFRRIESQVAWVLAPQTPGRISSCRHLTTKLATREGRWSCLHED